MIKVTLLNGLPRLLNPAFIQEVGNYHSDERGNACPHDSPDAEVRTFVLMTGGHDPIDVVEQPHDIAAMKTAWEYRSAYAAAPSRVLYAQVSADSAGVVELVTQK